jgi:hypothetical protein
VLTVQLRVREPVDLCIPLLDHLLRLGQFSGPLVKSPPALFRIVCVDLNVVQESVDNIYDPVDCLLQVLNGLSRGRRGEPLEVRHCSVQMADCRPRRT